MQHGNNPYASPRVPNPCLNIVRRPWEDSSPEEVELVAIKLLELCSVINLFFSYPYLTVVLKNYGRTYARHSLPDLSGLGPQATITEARYAANTLSRALQIMQTTPNIAIGVRDQTN